MTAPEPVELTLQQRIANARRVAEGAAWLDRVEPGWAKLVDLDLLDLDSPCHCVLGQLVGLREEGHGFYDAVSRDPWMASRTALSMTWTDAVNRGFHVYDHMMQDLEPPLVYALFEDLTIHWRAAIAARD